MLYKSLHGSSRETVIEKYTRITSYAITELVCKETIKRTLEPDAVPSGEVAI